ncbi:trigger factor [uncultured Alistipes sp.]|uniref:trigger factor n=1 Tax=uncultured Alistipes sp. TaxID=538949 RepID=UPI0025FAE467|nr:trigger factor [uncultured Alistipes sp.]
MNIVREQREQNTSLIRVTVGEQDYGEAVEKSLREYKRKANIPGFRPGMVPMGIVKKMYGKGVLAEQSYRTASNAVFEYLQKENIDYLGDVIPSEEQGDFDFENGTEFEFVFEIGEAPAVGLALSKEDKLTYNAIAVEKKMHDDYRANFLRRFGRLVDAEEVTSDEALSVTLDNGTMQVEDAYVGLVSMSEEERKPFIGQKVGYKTTVDVNELYKNPSQRAAVLQVKENELEGIDPKFTLEITKIRRFADPELTEEFFKMAFPAGNVTSEAELDAFVDAEIGRELRRESDYLFTLQLRDYLIAKAGLKMPEAFLKRWLYTINEGKYSMEEIEKDFEQFLKMFTWNYLQKHFIKEENISVSREEATAEAKALAQSQFAQYGMPSAPDEMLEGYAKQILESKEQGQKIYEKLYEVKVVEAVKSKIDVTEKSIPADEFAALARAL